MHLEKVVVIIPALNPKEVLPKIVKNLHLMGFSNIIVVNDGSSSVADKYFLEASQYSIVLKHEFNKGKGSALKTAFKYCLEKFSFCEGIVTADADGQHLIEDILGCANNLDSESLLLGCRNFFANEIPIRSKFGNIFTRTVLNLLCGIKISDTQTGLRGIPRKFVRIFLQTCGEGFDYEMNMLLECYEKNIPIKEFTIKTVYIKNNNDSHFNPIRDSLRIFYPILKYTFSSMGASFIDFLTFSILIYFNFNLAYALFISRVVGATINFFTNKNFVFHSKSKILLSAGKYILLVFTSGILSFWITTLLSKWVNVIIAKVFAESALFIFNFMFQRIVVFKK